MENLASFNEERRDMKTCEAWEKTEGISQMAI